MFSLPLNTSSNDKSTSIKSPSGFHRLPLELRNEIYQYVIGDIRWLNVLDGRWFGSLRGDGPRRVLIQHIPRCLFLNRQILKEAIQIAPNQVSGIKAFGPRHTTNVFPPDKVLQNIRRLEFTSPQPFYASNKRGTCSSPEDVALRCPRLEELSILFPATRGMANKFAFDLVDIFENKKLFKLVLGYRDAPMDGWSTDYSLFQPLESWFLRECKKRKRKIDLTIDIAPGRRPESYEERKVQIGCITYMHGFDMFG